MSYVLGVDLGTTYTAAAVLRDGRVEVVELGDRVASVASVLWFRDDHGLVVGEAAARRAKSEPGRVAREFKRRFGDPVPIMVAGTPISADALTARLLWWVIEVVTEQEGGEPAVVGMAHPANWGPYKLDLLAQAVRLAGVNRARFVSEPHAAAESHATAAQVGAGAVVAVYDLGGGTFDAAVLQRGESGFELLGAEGIERLGGIDFDEAVFDHVRQALGPGLTGLDQEDPGVAQALVRLRDDCTRAKEALSSDTEVSIPVALPGVHTTVRLCRDEFEEMIRPIVASTIGTLSRAIASAGLTPAQVSKVLLVGGSSRIPLVSLMISTGLGCPVALDTHPKHAVAMGSAYLAGCELPATAPSGDPPTLPQIPVPPVAAQVPEAVRPQRVAGGSAAAVGPPVRPGRRSGRRWPARAKRVALAAVLVAMVGVGTLLVDLFLVDIFRPAAAEVFLEPADRPGPDAFTPNVADPGNPPVPTPDLGREDGQVLGTRGDGEGLYGGADNRRICNKEQLIGFLVQDQAKGAAWANALGIQPVDIPHYIDGLTPGILQLDTRVTNHGYRDGKPEPRHAVLQAGTAVLVNNYGLPRVKCGGGNPLTDAESITKPNFSGSSWAGFDPGSLSRVVPAEHPVERLVLRDVHTGRASSRPVGTDGERDVESTEKLPPPGVPVPSSRPVPSSVVVSPSGRPVPSSVVVPPSSRPVPSTVLVPPSGRPVPSSVAMSPSDRPVPSSVVVSPSSRRLPSSDRPMPSTVPEGTESE